MRELERDVLERRLSEQEIYRQTLEEKNRKIQELENRVRYLTDLLQSIAVSRPQPSRERVSRTSESVPRRWRAQ